MHWQSSTASSWSSASLPDSLVNSAFRPLLLQFATKVFGKTDSALLAGSHFLSLVDLSDGSLMAEIGLPCPTRPSSVIVGDFNDDGFNDVLIACPNGLTGVALRVQPARGLTALLAVVVAAGPRSRLGCQREEKGQRLSRYSEECPKIPGTI